MADEFPLDKVAADAQKATEEVKRVTTAVEKMGDQGKKATGLMQKGLQKTLDAAKELKSPLEAADKAGANLGKTLAKAGESIQTTWRSAVGTLGRVAAGLTGVGVGVTVVYGKLRKLTDAYSDLGTEARASIETMEVQFKSLMGSADEAKVKIKQLMDEATRTPFRQQAYANASRHLRVLGGVALDTQSNLRMVGDAAAATNGDLESTSYWVGRLYQALANGEPAGEASRRLMELSVITGQTKVALDRMSESGASFGETWAMVEQELRRNEGAMQDLSKTFEGLKTTLADAQEIMLASFGKGFENTQKEQLEATIKTINALTPVVEDLGGMLGIVDREASKFGIGFKQRLADLIEGSQAAKHAIIGGLIAAFVAVSTVSVAATVWLTQFGIAALIAGARAGIMGKSLAYAGGLMRGMIVATKALAAGHTALAGKAMMAAMAGKTKASVHAAEAAAAGNAAGANATLGAVMVRLSAAYKSAVTGLLSFIAPQMVSIRQTTAQTSATVMNAAANTRLATGLRLSATAAFLNAKAFLANLVGMKASAAAATWKAGQLSLLSKSYAVNTGATLANLKSKLFNAAATAASTKVTWGSVTANFAAVKAKIANATATGVLSTAMVILRNVVGGTMALMKGLVAFLVMTPWVAAVAGITAIAGSLAYLAVRARKAHEELQTLRAVNRDLKTSFENTRAAMRSSAQLTEQQTNVIGKLIEAERQLHEMVRRGGKERIQAQRQIIKTLDAELEKLNAIQRANLEMSEREKEFRHRQADERKEVGEMEEDADIDAMDVDSAMAAKQARLAENEAAAEAAIQEIEISIKNQEELDELTESIETARAEAARAQTEIEVLTKEYEFLQERKARQVGGLLPKDQQREEEIIQRVGELRKKKRDAEEQAQNAAPQRLVKMLTEGTDLQQVDATVHVASKYQAALKQQSLANEKLQELQAKPKKERGKDYKAELAAAENQKVAADAGVRALEPAVEVLRTHGRRVNDNLELEDERGVDVADPDQARTLGNLGEFKKREEDRIQEDSDLVELARERLELERQIRELQEQRARDAITTQNAIDQLEVRGFDRVLQRIEGERAILALKMKQSGADKVALKQQMDVLDAREKEARERNKEATAGIVRNVSLSATDAQLEVAQKQGDTDTIDRVTARKEALERESYDAQTKKMAEEKFEEGDPQKEAFIRRRNLAYEKKEQSAEIDKEEAIREQGEQGVMDDLGRQIREAYEDGDQKEARRMEDLLDAMRVAEAGREAARKADNLGLTGKERSGYIRDQKEQTKAGIIDARQEEREEREKRTSRDKRLTEADLLEAQGKTDEARAKRDEVAAEEKADEYRAQGYDKNEAKAMAEADVEIARLRGAQGSEITASSLASIGAGGNVAGFDNIEKINERIRALLEKQVAIQEQQLEEVRNGTDDF